MIKKKLSSNLARDAKLFILGCCFMTAIILIGLIFTNNLPFLKAAGVGTGAPDINAKYHDGYATSLASSSAVIYVSNASGYLPTSTVDTNAIFDGSVSSADLADGACLAEILDDDGTGSTLDADTLDGSDSSDFIGTTCTVRTATGGPGSGTLTATASCVGDEIVTGGGIKDTNDAATLMESLPNGSNGWYCKSYKATDSRTLTCYAVCCD